MNRPLAAALAASALVLAGATPALASAKPAVVHHPKVSADTLMTNRLDSGGNGDWANDQFTRKVTIDEQTPTALSNCGVTVGQCFLIAGAKLTDTDGTFTTISDAFTPNQFGTDHGLRITNVVSGKMSGNGEFPFFYATELPDAHKVPATNDGDANPSPTWPELAFPAGTQFTGLSEDTFSYSYHHGTQHWLDANSTNGGQSADAGNITG
jgi:hypothetical protein